MPVFLWAWLATLVDTGAWWMEIGREGLVLSDEDIRKEREHFEAVVNAFVHYR